MEARETTRRGGVFGLYGPDSEAWRLNREAMLLLAAGPRALLMQLAHPLVAEGVDQHSNFRQDPWGRLHGTLRSYLRIVFGTERAARAEIERLNRLHTRVTGPVSDPTARETSGAATYTARDPALAFWVHATLVDSTLVANDAWIARLPRERQAAFYEETKPIAEWFGVPASMIPSDFDAFERYMAKMIGPGGPVQVTSTARDLAQTILHPPLGPVVRTVGELDARPGVRDGLAAALACVPVQLYDWTMWPALELLPDAIRTGYGIPQTPARRLVSDLVVAGFRFWRPLLPAAFRSMPQALAGDVRMGRLSGASTARSMGAPGQSA